MEIVQGIILKTSPYSETQKIIRIYTKEKGYLSMISPSVVIQKKNQNCPSPANQRDRIFRE